MAKQREQSGIKIERVRDCVFTAHKERGLGQRSPTLAYPDFVNSVDAVNHWAIHQETDSFWRSSTLGN